MEKVNVFIYGTCQGGAVSKFLKTNKEFCEGYNITEEVLSYVMVNDNISNWSDNNKNIREADVFFYQPIDDVYGKNSTNYLKSLLKPSCRTISMARIYNTAIYPFLVVMKRDISEEWFDKRGDRLDYLNRGVIDGLVAQGLKKIDILRLFDNNQIDFKFDQRYREVMTAIKDKEIDLDIKVHDYILDNMSKKKLFMYCTHPTSPLFVHVANQILTILGCPLLVDNFPMDFAGITGFGIPNEMPTCSNNYFKFAYNTPQGEQASNAYYKYLISEYLKAIKVQ